MQALPSHDRPARQLHGAAAILGASVLMDSAVEHYRGSFKNEAMILPLISSALNIACGLHGMSAAESDSHKGRTLAYIAAIGVGTIGTGFHVYNVEEARWRIPLGELLLWRASRSARRAGVIRHGGACG